MQRTMAALRRVFVFIAALLLAVFVVDGGVDALEGSVKNLTINAASYGGRTAYILAYTPPDSVCGDAEAMPLTVFLPGFGDTAEFATGTKLAQVFEALDEAIVGKETCCSLLVMPNFELGPFGGYWYINNPNSRPEDFLILEVMPTIEEYYGDKLSANPEARTLAGHSMGGYGAIRHALTYGGQYFGWAAGVAPALLIWTEQTYLDTIRFLILQEQTASPLFEDSETCPDQTEPPFTYYADYNSFITLVTASLAYIMNSDYTGVRANTPAVLGPALRTVCTEYQQFPYYNFFLDENGDYVQETIDQLQPDYSPIKFTLQYGSVVQPVLDGRLWMSTGFNDTTVQSIEVFSYSSALSAFNIDHGLYTFIGVHNDIKEPTKEMLTTFFKNGACAVALKDAENDDGAASSLRSPLAEIF